MTPSRINWLRTSASLVAAALVAVAAGACDSSSPHRSSSPKHNASTTTTAWPVRIADVYPSPGTLTASPTTNVVFRNVGISSLGDVQITGSSSGAHHGRLRSQADKQGVVFTPDVPFTEGESVAVSTGVKIAGSSTTSFTFAIARQYHPLVPAIIDVAPATVGDGRVHYRSTALTASKVTIRGVPSSDPVFLSPTAAP